MRKGVSRRHGRAPTAPLVFGDCWSLSATAALHQRLLITQHVRLWLQRARHRGLSQSAQYRGRCQAGCRSTNDWPRANARAPNARHRVGDHARTVSARLLPYSALRSIAADDGSQRLPRSPSHSTYFVHMYETGVLVNHWTQARVNGPNWPCDKAPTRPLDVVWGAVGRRTRSPNDLGNDLTTLDCVRKSWTANDSPASA